MKIRIFKLAAALVIGTATLPQSMLLANTAHESIIGQGIEWTTNYRNALAKSNATSRPIILFFTGSDWCTWCTKLEQEVLDTQAFANSAAGKYIFVKLDFPKRAPIDQAVKQQNASLQKKYNISGYPTLLIIDGQENVLAQTGYQQGGPDRYASHLDQLISRQKPQYIAATPSPVMEEQAESQYDLAVNEFEKLAEEMDNGAVVVEEAIHPLVAYIDNHPDDENTWKLQMTVSQVYYENERLDDALLFATQAHDAAPAAIKDDIQRVISSIEIDLKDRKEIAQGDE